MVAGLESLEGGWPVHEVAAALGAPLGEKAAAELVTWLDLVVKWNRTHDLTAARDASELVDLMLSDALALSAHVPSGVRVVDVGTGAGAPGLALAFLRPDLQLTLVEPLGKRIAFLRTVIGSTKRLDVKLLHGRGEDIAAKIARGDLCPFDVALSRATLPPGDWLALGARLVPHGTGAVFVLLAKDPPPDRPGFRVGARASYVWPKTGASRTLLQYVREDPNVEPQESRAPHPSG